MPSAPSYLDAAAITVSWTIDKALDCDLESIVEDYLDDADLFYFNTVADLPPPEPPLNPDPVTSTIGDQDPSHIARLSSILLSLLASPSVLTLSAGSYCQKMLSQPSSAPSTN